MERRIHVHVGFSRVSIVIVNCVYLLAEDLSITYGEEGEGKNRVGNREIWRSFEIS